MGTALTEVGVREAGGRDVCNGNDRLWTKSAKPRSREFFGRDLYVSVPVTPRILSGIARENNELMD